MCYCKTILLTVKRIFICTIGSLEPIQHLTQQLHAGSVTFTLRTEFMSLLTATLTVTLLTIAYTQTPLGNAQVLTAAQPADAFAFLEDEAGIALYMQRAHFDLDRLQAHYRVLEVATPDYLLGSVPVPGYEAFENYDAYVYARADGWLVVYYPQQFPSAFIVDWLAYDASRTRATSATTMPTSTIPTKLERVAALFGARFGSAENDVRFYDFRRPEADSLLLITDYGATGRLEFSYELPRGLNALDVSFSQTAQGNCLNLLHLNEQLVFDLIGPEEHAANLPLSARETGVRHHITSYNSDSICSAPAHAGVAVTSHAATTVSTPSQRVRMRSAERRRNIALAPLAPVTSPTSAPLFETTSPTISLIP